MENLQNEFWDVRGLLPFLLSWNIYQGGNQVLKFLFQNLWINNLKLATFNGLHNLEPVDVGWHFSLLAHYQERLGYCLFLLVHCKKVNYDYNTVKILSFDKKPKNYQLLIGGSDMFLFVGL